MNYRREIDGLRALAVIPVILFHAGFGAFGGGFVGVDVFFVISGYLITSIIWQELERDRFSILNFYERRARRILPALFLVIACCLPFAWIVLLPEDLRNFSQSLVAVSFFSSNILFWSESGYFDSAAELKPLLHTWSLAVEEQFYILFPMALILAHRMGKAFVLAGIMIVAGLSLWLAQWGVSVEPTATFYLLPTRGWELLVGSLAALWLYQRPPKRSVSWVDQALAGVGLALIVYSICAFDKQTPFPGAYALFPTVGTALLILFANKRTAVGALLGTQALVSVGLISYSAYLWHQPLFAFSRLTQSSEPSSGLLGLLSVLALVLAYLTWRYVETPTRNREKFPAGVLFFSAAVATLFFVALGLVGHFKSGFPSRIPPAAQIAGAELPSIDNGWCFYSIDSISRLTQGAKGLECSLGDRNSSVRGLLLGDSHAGHYEPLWHEAGQALGVRIDSVTTNYCHPSLRDEFPGSRSDRSFEQCIYNRRFAVENLARYDFVVLAGSWGEVMQHHGLDGVLEFVDFAASRVKVVIVMPTPKAFNSRPLKEYRKAVWQGRTFDISDLSTKKDRPAFEANDRLERAVSRYGNVVFIKRDVIFASGGAPSDVTSEGIPFSLDGGHLSIYGSLAAGRGFVHTSEFDSLRKLLR